jgi:hypothetical protein
VSLRGYVSWVGVVSRVSWGVEWSCRLVAILSVVLAILAYLLYD